MLGLGSRAGDKRNLRETPRLWQGPQRGRCRVSRTAGPHSMAIMLKTSNKISWWTDGALRLREGQLLPGTTQQVSGIVRIQVSFLGAQITV